MTWSDEAKAALGASVTARVARTKADFRIDLDALFIMVILRFVSVRICVAYREEVPATLRVALGYTDGIREGSVAFIEQSVNCFVRFRTAC